MAGFFNYRGNQDLVPTTEEEHQYDRYRSALAVVPGEPKRILASAGSKLFLFDQLAADGLTFQRMRSVPLPGETNRMKGWQEIAIEKPQPVQYVRISNDANGMGNFNDGHLHLLRLELLADGRNIAAPDAIESVTGTRDDVHKKPMVVRPMNMFQPDNANTDTELRATTFGFYRGGAVVKLKAPAALERIRFLLSNRQTQWYNQLDSFLWQGRLLRVGFEEDEIFYHYKVEVSADGKEWTVVGDRTRNDRISVFPEPVDWDGDGRFDLLVNSRNADWLRQVAADDGGWRFRTMGPLAPANIEGHDVSPTTVDFDGDGVRDFLGGAEDGRLYFLANPHFLANPRTPDER